MERWFTISYPMLAQENIAHANLVLFVVQWCRTNLRMMIDDRCTTRICHASLWCNCRYRVRWMHSISLFNHIDKLSETLSPPLPSLLLLKARDVMDSVRAAWHGAWVMRRHGSGRLPEQAAGEVGRPLHNEHASPLFNQVSVYVCAPKPHLPNLLGNVDGTSTSASSQMVPMATVPNVLSGIDEVLCPRHFAFFSGGSSPPPP